MVYPKLCRGSLRTLPRSQLPAWARYTRAGFSLKYEDSTLCDGGWGEARLRTPKMKELLLCILICHKIKASVFLSFLWDPHCAAQRGTKPSGGLSKDLVTS